jgi:soluble lytic murein transglycosylase-like protein
MKRLIMVVMMFLYIGEAKAEPYINIQRIIQIESSGNPHAISRDGFNSIGLMQISPCVLQDYNRIHKTNLKSRHLFSPETNIKVGNWYINKHIPKMLKYYKKEDTERNRIIAYNAGIKNAVKGRTPKITKQYLIKYFSSLKTHKKSR